MIYTGSFLVKYALCAADIHYTVINPFTEERATLEDIDGRSHENGGS